MPPPAVGARGQRVTVSWSAADPGHGPLSIEIKHAEGDGMPYISGRFGLPSEGGTWTFSARMRATGIERLLVNVYAARSAHGKLWLDAVQLKPKR